MHLSEGQDSQFRTVRRSVAEGPWGEGGACRSARVLGVKAGSERRRTIGIGTRTHNQTSGTDLALQHKSV